MADIFSDRVLETTTTTGTGDILIDGAVVGFQTFSNRCAVGDTVPYAIYAVDAGGVPTGFWETGVGTLSGSAAPDGLERTTVHDSSNGGDPVDFAAGTKYVMLSPVAAMFARFAKPTTTMIFGLGDETNVITTGSSTKVTFRMPFGLDLEEIRASLNVASSSGNPTVDVKMDDVTVFGTLLTVDEGAKSSAASTIPATLAITVLDDDAEITIEVTDAGTDAEGMKIYLVGYRR